MVSALLVRRARPADEEGRQLHTALCDDRAGLLWAGSGGLLGLLLLIWRSGVALDIARLAPVAPGLLIGGGVGLAYALLRPGDWIKGTRATQRRAQRHVEHRRRLWLALLVNLPAFTITLTGWVVGRPTSPGVLGWRDQLYLGLLAWLQVTCTTLGAQYLQVYRSLRSAGRR